MLATASTYSTIAANYYYLLQLCHLKLSPLSPDTQLQVSVPLMDHREISLLYLLYRRDPAPPHLLEWLSSPLVRKSLSIPSDARS